MITHAARTGVIIRTEETQLFFYSLSVSFSPSVPFFPFLFQLFCLSHPQVDQYLLHSPSAFVFMAILDYMYVSGWLCLCLSLHLFLFSVSVNGIFVIAVIALPQGTSCHMHTPSSLSEVQVELCTNAPVLSSYSEETAKLSRTTVQHSARIMQN